MAVGLVDQNRKLKEAAKQPRDTTGQKEQASKYSAKIASDAPKKIAQESKVQTQKSSGKVVRGSFEGYMYSRSSYVQFKGAGYDAKNQQMARYKDKSIDTLSNFRNNSFTGNKNYSIMSNYSSMTRENSSSDRLSKIISNNMQFK